ncbi:glycosyltransferase family 4 protein [Bacillus sp. BRMEA1]|uniref:glycosyltransferase family 4 protein n=1 Tax=Neobacillus endophyticus TaxID=2738405 RepID=UPI0015655317|nr:glycosyltransferase family 4 protein [Neobacillus endophyticus]NRD76329.1 glycosyltransferase family 4 protein [Neobacillus endophyticus]
MKKKLVFISNMAAPYQVKFCYSLQKYFDAEFWFYVKREQDRPKWWEIPLGDKCRILKFSGSIPYVGYYSFGVFAELLRFNPDIILLGGFMNWHWLILKWAKIFNKKVVIMSEPLRNVKSERDDSNLLLNRDTSPQLINKLRKRFFNADLYLGMGKVAAKQFVQEIGFDEKKVSSTMYPQDIEAYFDHPLRTGKKEQDYTLLFANRLVDRYQPLFALEVFMLLKVKYPHLKLLMNNDGPLKSACLKYIEDENIKDVKFLKEIDSWNNMHLIYKNADILILPATYSNGNGTIIEAAASGMGFVVSQNINHMQKYAKNGENCYICDLSTQSFVDAISNYIEAPELLMSHGKLSRKLIEDRKNEYTSKEYFEILERYGLNC